MIQKPKHLGYKGFIQAKDFDWGLHPEVEKFLQKEVNKFLKNNNYARSLSKSMEKTSTRFFDWIDHIVIQKDENTLKKLGFKEIKTKNNEKVFKHFDTILFPVILSDKTEIALKPENLDDFIKKNRIKTKIQSGKFSPFRKAEINKQGDYLLTAVERRGSNEFLVQNSNDIKQYKKALNIFKKRARKFKTDEKGMLETKNLVKKVLKILSKQRTADAFFRTEREYWEKRNTAGGVQKTRQDKLGLGWGNHDHHTFRSSRRNFTELIDIFELMGYECRERFFAGEKAGWGAQILEHPQCDIVIFADTDITKKEKDKDFAHKGLQNKDKLGTVGLWVALHGESILQSGMHHLEARFDFNKLKKDLPNKKINIMGPFSYFPFLKQAFTQGEIWRVEKSRLDKLLKQDSITKDEYNRFLKEGALGSHLENLQRTQGFKGFNQDSVTAIIKATDPRKQKTKGA